MPDLGDTKIFFLNVDNSLIRSACISQYEKSGSRKLSCRYPSWWFEGRVDSDIRVRADDSECMRTDAEHVLDGVNEEEAARGGYNLWFRVSESVATSWVSGFGV